MRGGPIRAYDMTIHMKRTTLILDAALYAALRRQAATDQRTLTEVVERTLRAGLRATAAMRRGRRPLPSYDLGPYLVDPADREALARVLAGPTVRVR